MDVNKALNPLERMAAIVTAVPPAVLPLVAFSALKLLISTMQRLVDKRKRNAMKTNKDHELNESKEEFRNL